MPNDLKNNFIAVNAPVISNEAKKYVNDCLDTGWISSAGPYVEKFERAFSEMIGVKPRVAVCNGTAALHTALLSLGIKEGLTARLWTNSIRESCCALLNPPISPLHRIFTMKLSIKKTAIPKEPRYGN